MPDNNNYNTWVQKFIEFSEKQVIAQVEQKNSLKNITKCIMDIDNKITNEESKIKDIRKKLNKMIMFISIVGGIFLLAWGYFSIIVDNIVDKKIIEYIDDSNAMLNKKLDERQKIEKIISDILNKHYKDIKDETS